MKREPAGKPTGGRFAKDTTGKTHIPDHNALTPPPQTTVTAPTASTPDYTALHKTAQKLAGTPATRSSREQYMNLLRANEATHEIMSPPTGDGDWADSPFLWIRRLPPHPKGKAGELIAENWLTEHGFTVTPPKSSQYDRTVNGHPVEVKLSTLWDKGVFAFQQLRNQDYEHAFLIGISPHDIRIWFVPKETLLKHSTVQHGGGTGENADTRWIQFPADTPPDWISEYGGDPDVALANIKQALG